MEDVATLAHVFGRIAALGVAYRIDIQRLVQRASVLVRDPARMLLVAVPHAFDRVAVMAELKKAEMVPALALCDGDQLARVDTLAGGADTTGAVIELESVPGAPDQLAVSVQALGRRALDSDLARLARFGVAVEPVREVANALGSGRLIGVTDHSAGPAWTLHFSQPNATPAQRDIARAHLDRAAELVGATPAQRHMVAGLHDVLAAGRESFALVKVRPSGVQLAVLWGLVPWEHVVRMMLQLYAGDSAKKLGELAGAVDSDVAAMVEVTLGGAAPPAMRVAAQVRAGGKS
ncbi:MAG TPA: hypothetical protein VGF94_28370 [Kofleriaceae bacterium]